MNAAVRAITRFAIARGLRPVAVLEGFQGLIDAGDKMKVLAWDDVARIVHLGGTVLGSSRSAAFRTTEGRRLAVRNMVKRGMDALIVIGGDGSLTGADTLRAEWPGHVKALVESGHLTPHEAEPYKHKLTIVGMAGSIDNDMGRTDLTIGSLTALHRVCESLAAIVSTAQSHARCFVVEVMGRHC
ncbi:6-phosphofructokinase, alpha subunit, partial [Gonapodya sp. JEL0774]